MTDSRPHDDGGESLRPLSAFSASTLIIGNMIGVGLVTTTGFLSAEIGNALVILGMWLVGGVLAMCGAAVYAELGSQMPRAGGEYVYLSRIIHPMAGFLSGWISLLVGFSAPIALTAYAAGLYLETAFPEIPARAAAAGLIISFTLLHLGQVSWGARAHTALTIYKVVLVLLLAVTGFSSGNGDWSYFVADKTMPGVDLLAMALVFVSFAYSGWNVAAYVASEIRDAPRALPQALLYGTGSAVVLFLLLNIVFFYSAPTAVLAESPEQVAYVVTSQLFGDATGSLVSVLITIALVSSVSAMIMAGPRVYAAMANDRLFFAVFSNRSRGGSPWASILLQCVIALAMLATATFENLLTYIGVTLSIFSGLTVIAAFVQRRRVPVAPAGTYRAFLWPVPALLYLGLTLMMTVFVVYHRPVIVLSSLATVVSGVLFYLAFQRMRPGRESRSRRA